MIVITVGRFFVPIRSQCWFQLQCTCTVCTTSKWCCSCSIHICNSIVCIIHIGMMPLICSSCLVIYTMYVSFLHFISEGRPEIRSKVIVDFLFERPLSGGLSAISPTEASGDAAAIPGALDPL